MEINIKKAEGNAINIISTANNDNKKEESSKENIKKALFFDKKSFKVDEIIEKCKEKDGIELLNYMCSVMQERKRNILEMLYKDLGKNYLIVKLEKALIIENSGGLLKEKNIYAKKREVKGNESKMEDNVCNDYKMAVLKEIWNELELDKQLIKESDTYEQSKKY